METQSVTETTTQSVMETQSAAETTTQITMDKPVETTTKILFKGDLISDPFRLPDSDLWLNLLLLAREKSAEVYGILKYIREVGAVLTRDERHGLMLKPIYGEQAWVDEAHWQDATADLAKYLPLVKQLLKQAAECRWGLTNSLLPAYRGLTMPLVDNSQKTPSDARKQP